MKNAVNFVLTTSFSYDFCRIMAWISQKSDYILGKCMKLNQPAHDANVCGVDFVNL
jgi:hypothetical protein